MNIKQTFGSALLCGALLLAGCGPQGRADTMNAPRNVPPEDAVATYDMERAELDADIVVLRDRIDVRLEEVDRRLAREDVGLDERRQLVRHRDELQDRRNVLERSRRDIDASRQDNWNSVRSATKNTVADIGDWFERQGERIEDAFEDDDDVEDAGIWIEE